MGGLLYRPPGGAVRPGGRGDGAGEAPIRNPGELDVEYCIGFAVQDGNLVDGETLADRLKRGPLPVTGVLTLDELVMGFAGKVLALLGKETEAGWRAEELE